MKIEIIAIADEILSGNTVNTNASFMSRELSKKGYEINRHCVFSDEKSFLEKGLEEVLERVDLAIFCGGLGPTEDDRTKSLICKIFQTKLEIDRDIKKKLATRFKHHEKVACIQEQSSIPKGAVALYNKVGTAPGLILEKKQKYFIFLPGVPSELIPMFLEDVLPFVEQKFPLKEALFQKEICFCQIPEMEINQYLQTLSKEVYFGIYPSLGTVRVVMKKKAKNITEAQRSFSQVLDSLKKQFSTFIFDAPNGLIEEAVHRAFKEKQATLSIAESCTGGSVAKKLTSLEGASVFFLGSVVCYSNEIKKSVLNVSEQTLQSKGAVSEEVIQQMLQGLLKNFSSDYAVATSGIAGPTGATPEKPVGTVYIGVGEKKGKTKVEKFHFSGGRQRIIELSSNYALSLIYKMITHG